MGLMRTDVKAEMPAGFMVQRWTPQKKTPAFPEQQRQDLPSLGPL
jgi:hypothetical protein